MRGSRDVFEAELLAAIGALRADALSLTRDPLLSEDLVQETLMRAWRARESYARASRMRRWLFVILRNCAVNERHRRRADARASPQPPLLAGMTPYNPIARLELADAAACYARLTPTYREALKLVVDEGLQYEAAAKRIGCSVNTLKSRVRRGRRDLRLLTEGLRPTRKYQPISKRRSVPAIP